MNGLEINNVIFSKISQALAPEKKRLKNGEAFSPSCEYAGQDCWLLGFKITKYSDLPNTKKNIPMVFKTMKGIAASLLLNLCQFCFKVAME